MSCSDFGVRLTLEKFLALLYRCSVSEVIPNPNFKEDHLSCDHFESVSKMLESKFTYCPTCGVKCDIIRYPKTIEIERYEKICTFFDGPQTCYGFDTLKDVVFSIIRDERYLILNVENFQQGSILNKVHKLCVDVKTYAGGDLSREFIKSLDKNERVYLYVDYMNRDIWIDLYEYLPVKFLVNVAKNREKLDPDNTVNEIVAIVSEFVPFDLLGISQDIQRIGYEDYRTSNDA